MSWRFAAHTSGYNNYEVFGCPLKLLSRSRTVHFQAMIDPYIPLLWSTWPFHSCCRSRSAFPRVLSLIWTTQDHPGRSSKKTNWPRSVPVHVKCLLADCGCSASSSIRWIIRRRRTNRHSAWLPWRRGDADDRCSVMRERGVIELLLIESRVTSRPTYVDRPDHTRRATLFGAAALLQVQYYQYQLHNDHPRWRDHCLMHYWLPIDIAMWSRSSTWKSATSNLISKLNVTWPKIASYDPGDHSPAVVVEGEARMADC